MTIKDFKVGDVVFVHPASNWFMRGVRFATVVKIGRRLLTVRATTRDIVFKLSPVNVEGIA